jgi:hypothetical protein
MQASLAAPAGRSISAPTVVNNRTAAFCAKRITAIARPADLAEDGLNLLIRHARNRRERERLGAAGEEEMLRRLYSECSFRIRYEIRSSLSTRNRSYMEEGGHF